ncbi:MAG: glycosyltransferase [Tenuifilaceae bacterium]
MSFKLLSISSMYDGYLRSFYSDNSVVKDLAYDEHYKMLLEGSTEFVSSYTKTYNKLGIEAKCLIANDSNLQGKWIVENGFKSKKSEKILFEQTKRYQPEVLLIEDFRFISKEWIEIAKKEIKSIKLVIAYHCAPYRSNILGIFKNIDFLITCTPGLKEEFGKYGIKTYTVYHGFDVDFISRVQSNTNIREHNLIFSGSLFPGNGYHIERIELIEALIKEKIDISLYVNTEKNCKIKAKQIIHLLNEFFKRIGLGRINSFFPLLEHGEKPIKNYSNSLLRVKQEPIYGFEMYKLLAKSKVVLNNHGEIAGEYAGNMRLFEATGVGSCLLTDNKKNMSELFEPDYEVVVYNSLEECIAKAKWLLENETERKKIAIAGQNRTLKNHTVENRCNQIIDIINKELAIKRSSVT